MESSSTAAVLLLNLPPKALGGIDLLSFTTTPKFQGIKNIPPGFHFLFTGSTTTLSVRHGAWINITSTGKGPSPGPADLFIKKWDTDTEALVAETGTAQTLHWRANLGSIWKEGLTPYRQSASSSSSSDVESESNDWRDLTSCMSEPLLHRIIGPDPNTWTLTSASSAAVDVDDIPGLTASEARSADERELLFLPIDLKKTWREGATGRERTDAAQDRSWYLSDLVGRHCASGGWDEVLGELQFCFLMVLTLNNYSCLEQWRRVVSVVFTCRSAVVERAEFFERFLAVLRLQLKHCDDVDGGGLFDLADEGVTFLKPLIVGFKKILEELPGGGKQDVMDELDELQDYLHDSHGWNFQQGQFTRSGMVTLEDGEEVDMDDMTHDQDDEWGEYAPQIVDLTSEQLQELGFGKGAVPTDTMKSLKDTLRDEDSERESDDVESFEDDEEETDLEEMDARY